MCSSRKWHAPDDGDMWTSGHPRPCVDGYITWNRSPWRESEPAKMMREANGRVAPTPFILANPTSFSGRIPENWTCYRATGNFVISTGFLSARHVCTKARHKCTKTRICVGAHPETVRKMKAIHVMTASLRSVACDVVESSMRQLVCFGSDFDHDGELLMTERLQYSWALAVDI